MWVFIQTEFKSRDGNDLFTVGFYDPTGKFIGESDHAYKEEAAKRCNYLNGGQKTE